MSKEFWRAFLDAFTFNDRERALRTSGVRVITEEEREFQGPKVLVSAKRFDWMLRTVVSCWTCHESIRMVDAADTDLGWGYIETSIGGEEGKGVHWECPRCAEGEDW